MIGITFAAMMGVSVNCNDVIAKPAAATNWHSNVCIELAKSYRDIEITPFKRVVVKNDIRTQKASQLPVISPLKAGKLKVAVIEGVDNNSLMEVVYTLNIDAYSDAWILARPLSAGKVISEKDIARSSVNVSPFVGVKDLLIENPVGKKIKRDQQRSSILFSDSTEIDDLISIGDELIATIVNENMNIETNAIALENGSSRGDKIKVRLTATGATFLATILGTKNVKIDI